MTSLTLQPPREPAFLGALLGVLASSRDPSLHFAVLRSSGCTADLGADFPSLQQTRYLCVQGVRGTGGGRSNPAPCGAIPLLFPAADPSLMGQTLELTGGLSRILLRSLGQREGCTQRLLMHQIYPLNLLFHTVKGGFLALLPWRRGAARSAHPHYVAPEHPAPLHSWHICTSFLPPQSCLRQLPWAISPCK